MHRLRTVALAALLAALALLGYAAADGQLRIGFLLIVPFVVATGGAGALGMLLLFAALVLWFFGGVQVAREGAPMREPDVPTEPPGTAQPPAERRHGGVVLLGPIPIVWGSDRRILPWMIAAGGALLLLALVVAWMLRP